MFQLFFSLVDLSACFSFHMVLFFLITNMFFFISLIFGTCPLHSMVEHFTMMVVT